MNTVYLEELVVRCLLAARNCSDPIARNELEKLAEEFSIEVERMQQSRQNQNRGRLAIVGKDEC
jgi:hypothetical protein